LNVVGAVLCGGWGKRLHPITLSIPKSLIELKNGYTVLDRQLLQMKHSGVDVVYLLVGFLREKIKDRYKDEWRGVKLRYLEEDRPRGTLYGIRSLMLFAEADAYLVMNGDVVTDINLRQMLMEWKPGTMSMALTRMVSPYGIVDIVNGKVVAFKEKPLLPYYLNAGVYVIDKGLKPYFTMYEGGDVEKLVFPKLAEERLINCYVEEGVFWRSIDSPKDLEAVREEFSNRDDKPWGYEKLLDLTGERMKKQVYVMKGFRTPLHFHERRHEAVHVVSGVGYIHIEEEDVKVKQGDVVEIGPGKKHYIAAAENLTLLEYSTPHPNDVVSVNGSITISLSKLSTV